MDNKEPFHTVVIPAKAGIQFVNFFLKNLDSRLRHSGMTVLFRLFLIILTSGFLLGCSAERQLEHIKTLERKGRFYKAWEKYQEFAAHHPQHARAPEAVFRAGLVAQQHFNDCFMASTFYDEVLTRYPDSEPWARAALLHKNNCPDYFPLVDGSSWTEVDSDTKGRNARIEIVANGLTTDAKLLPTQAGKFTKTYFAGDKKSLVQELFYRKEQNELLESNSSTDLTPHVILKWPVDVGTRWSSKRDGRQLNFEIASLDRTVSVAGGDFEGCLHVRSYASGDSAVKNEYYAPGVGRILTSITSKAGEKRITELLSFHMSEAPDFLKEAR